MSKKQNQEGSSWVDKAVSVRRVTKVTKGGKRFSFSAFVVSGDQKGNVGIATGKGKDVSVAIAKATARAHKQMIAIPLRNTTIPYSVEGYHGACKVVLRSASKGTGIVAGSTVRAIMEALGIKDILTKSLGSPNSINVVKATLNALSKLRSIEHIAKLRGKTIQEITRGTENVTA